MNGANNERFKPMNQTPVKVRRKFDEMFKRESVQNWLVSGKSAERLPRNWDCLPTGCLPGSRPSSPLALGGKAAAGKPGSPADLHSQLDAALREVRHWREQRDILKKRHSPQFRYLNNLQKNYCAAFAQIKERARHLDPDQR